MLCVCAVLAVCVDGASLQAADAVYINFGTISKSTGVVLEKARDAPIELSGGTKYVFYRLASLSLAASIIRCFCHSLLLSLAASVPFCRDREYIES